MQNTENDFDSQSAKQIRNTEGGSRLYERWKRIKRKEHSKEFDTFLGFYKWSMKAGYSPGLRLLVADQNKPYSPDNCSWSPPETVRPVYGEEGREWIAKWNEAVNRIRVHYGMEPLATDDG